MKKHTPVTLRRRKLPSGLTSLYIDIYDRGERSYEYLRLYLQPEKNREAKAANKETLRLAEDIAARRLADILEERRTGKKVARMTFAELYDEMMDERKGSTRKVWLSKRRWFVTWRGWRMTLSEITAADVRELWRTLDRSELCNRTKGLVFANGICVMREAVRREIVLYNPFSAVDNFKGANAERVHLSADEVRRLAETECRHPELKRMFLFSCLTGLRRSDIVKLQWSDIDGDRVAFRQQKTGAVTYLPLSADAVRLLGERGDGLVFDPKGSNVVHNVSLRRWAAAAGIDKPLTFHSARHTFACLLLEADVDIYTVSKLLGHATVATTQIYAKIADKAKKAAVERLSELTAINRPSGK